MLPPESSWKSLSRVGQYKPRNQQTGLHWLLVTELAGPKFWLKPDPGSCFGYLHSDGLAPIARLRRVAPSALASVDAPTLHLQLFPVPHRTSRVVAFLETFALAAALQRIGLLPKLPVGDLPLPDRLPPWVGGVRSVGPLARFFAEENDPFGKISVRDDLARDAQNVDDCVELKKWPRLK